MTYRIAGASFPYLDKGDQKKRRPVLVLTKDVGPHSLVVVAYITTNTDVRESTDILLQQGDGDFYRSGLSMTSLILLHKLFSLPLENIYDEIGSLSPKKSEEVQEKLSILFNLI